MRARLREAVLANWGTKLTALALAALLWIAVAAEQPASQLVPVTLDVTLPGGRSLAQALPTVRALLVAPARELVKLYDTPPAIHKIVPDSVSSTRYVLELSPADVSLSISGAKVEDIEPRTVTVTLNAITRKAAAPDSAPPQRRPRG